MKDLINKETEMEQQMVYYQNIVEDFNKIKQMEEGQEEVILNYFFQKQDEINEKID